MARRDEEHYYADCLDPDCPRFACRVFKEGAEAGYWRGFVDGESTGFAAGFSAGMAAASGSGAAAA